MRKSETCTASNRYAFTLIEVLVAVAIIGLLMSIMIPALGRARGQANMVACKARLRNLGLGALMYADDNSSNLPFDCGMLGPSFNDPFSNTWICNPHTQLIKDLSSYVTGVENFYCPGWKNPLYCYSPENYASGDIGYFYFSVEKRPMFGGLSEFLYSPKKGDPMYYPHPLCSTMSPQMWIVSDMWFSGKSSKVPVPHRWYKKGVQYMALDGSIKMVYKSPKEEFK
jgi:prepilin-type N-terminal cleavage/methylation domain-containing protein